MAKPASPGSFGNTGVVCHPLPWRPWSHLVGPPSGCSGASPCVRPAAAPGRNAARCRQWARDLPQGCFRRRSRLLVRDQLTGIHGDVELSGFAEVPAAGAPAKRRFPDGRIYRCIQLGGRGTKTGRRTCSPPDTARPSTMPVTASLRFGVAWRRRVSPCLYTARTNIGARLESWTAAPSGRLSGRVHRCTRLPFAPSWVDVRQ
jgi:hypothetical protein